MSIRDFKTRPCPQCKKDTTFYLATCSECGYNFALQVEPPKKRTWVEINMTYAARHDRMNRARTYGRKVTGQTNVDMPDPGARRRR